MRCAEFYRLLNIFWREEDRETGTSLISTHIHGCPVCAHGLDELAQALLAIDDLSCEQCQSRFPTYYEAAHPDYPLAAMPGSEMIAVSLHLGQCAACREQYLALEQVSQMEEDDL